MFPLLDAHYSLSVALLIKKRDTYIPLGLSPYSVVFDHISFTDAA